MRKRPVILPFALAILLSYLLAPVIAWLTSPKVLNGRMPRGGAILLVYALVLGLIVLSGYYLFPKFYSEANRMVRKRQDDRAEEPQRAGHQHHQQPQHQQMGLLGQQAPADIVQAPVHRAVWAGGWNTVSAGWGRGGLPCAPGARNAPHIRSA